MKCKECGESLSKDMKNCPNCGTFVPQRVHILAIISIVIAVISVVYNRFGILSVAGIATSIVTMKLVKGTRNIGKGIAIGALVVSIITLIWLIGVTVLDNFVFLTK